MKKIYFIFIMILTLCLTGCGSNDKKDTKKEQKQIDFEPIEINKALFNWAGSYKNNEKNYSIDVYVLANNSSLYFEFVIPETDSSIAQFISFDAEEIDGDIIVVDNEDLGLKGTIKKIDNGFDVDLTLGDAHQMISLSGKYEKTKSVTDLEGYFIDGDYKVIAITPLAEDVLVSYCIVDDGLYNSNDLRCDYISDSKIVCSSENITINKTDKGLKVDTDNKKAAGEYTKK